MIAGKQGTKIANREGVGKHIWTKALISKGIITNKWKNQSHYSFTDSRIQTFQSLKPSNTSKHGSL